MAGHRRHRTLAAAALLLGSLTGTGAAGTAQAAASVPAALCPSATPTAAELAATLTELSAAGVAKSAGTGITVDIHEGDRGDVEEYTDQHFSADPWTGRVSRSWFDSGTGGTIDDWWERYVEVNAHRTYRHFGARRNATPRDRAVLTALAEGGDWFSHERWLRTTTSQTTSWPYRDYLDITGTARRALVGTGGYSFTCTVDGATAHVAATGPEGRRTYDLTVDDSGAPVDVRVDDAARPTTIRARARYDRPELSRPRSADVIGPAAYREAAVRGMTEDLRHDVLLWAGPEVKLARTRGRRLDVLRQVSGQRNLDLLQDYDLDAGLAAVSPVTSTATTLSSGILYTIRYGDATGTLRFSIEGRSIETTMSFR